MVRIAETREAVKALCEPVASPRYTAAYIHCFCAADTTNPKELADNEPKRVALYKQVTAFLRAYANLANEMREAGYSDTEAEMIRDEVVYYENVREAFKLASGEYIDMKVYEPAMRHVLDTYIRAEESVKISTFDDLSLVQLIVNRGVDAVDQLPETIKKHPEAVTETIENNVRKLITDESPVNPKYYEKMSALLDALIRERRAQAIAYEEYLKKIVDLTRRIKNQSSDPRYTPMLDTPRKTCPV